MAVRRRGAGMSYPMDPDGTNRIIQQRIGEWHRERNRDRDARLLEERGDGAPRRVLTGTAKQIRAVSRTAAMALRRARHLNRSTLPRATVEATPGFANDERLP